MARHIAFLHAVNVGGRLIANAELREQFEAMGFERVRTFISTGNVVFDTAMRGTPVMVRRIQQHLREHLGMDIPVFVRSEAELHAIVKHRAFDYDALHASKEMHIGLLADPLPSEAVQRLMALRTALDSFHVNHREIYWLCRARRNASAFSPAVFAKALHVPTTFRPLTTLLRMIPWIESERPSASRLIKKPEAAADAHEMS